MNDHPDDNFHPPRDDDPFWTETCWWTFAVPERRLSGQLYPFFRPNQNVASCAVYLWDDSGDLWHTAIYSRQTWHLPLNGQRLCDLQLPNGLRYRCLEPRTKYELGYADPDGDDVRIDLTFTAVAEPNHDGHGHYDQPGRMQGELVIYGETIEVDSFGFHDRSWGRRGGFGPKMVARGGHYAGYSFATASPQDGFHALTFDRGNGREEVVHGYLLRDGKMARLTSGTREVVKRDPATGFQTRVRLEAEDADGRMVTAAGECVNRFGFLLNPNIWSVNCLTRWTFDGCEGWGEDHENWTPVAQRRFYRRFLGYDRFQAPPLVHGGTR